MKRLALLCIAGILCFACNEQVRYTQDSAEIDIIKAHLSDYLKGDWESFAGHYADTAKIYHNSEDFILPNSRVEEINSSLKGISSYDCPADKAEYEMVISDDGKTWVNSWGLWSGTLAANNQKITIPFHITYQFKEGKIVQEHGFYDNSEVIAALQRMEEDAKTKEKTTDTE